jgi:RNA polymerase-binding transcription factor DksA
MAKKILKDNKIEETATKVETIKTKSASKSDNTKVVSKDNSIPQTVKAEVESKTSKKIAEVKIETVKKAEPVKEVVVEKPTKQSAKDSKHLAVKPVKAESEKKVPVIKEKELKPVKVTEVVSETKPVKENKISNKPEPLAEVIVPVAATEDASIIGVKSSKKEKITKPITIPDEVKIVESNEKKDSDMINAAYEKPIVKVEQENPVIEFAVAFPTVRYSDVELEEFAKIIRESKEEALDELRMLKERLEDLTSSDVAEESMIYSMHMAEQGSEAQEKEKTYAQIQRIQEYLKKLEDAMDRIKNKTYGICRVCGCLIAKARLMAVPITTLSASYKIHQRCPEDGNDRIEAIKK